MLKGPFNLSQTRELLTSLAHTPQKRLGQNFLVDGNIVRKSLSLAQIAPGDVVVEIGPGLGTLTTTLLQAGARVFAVERDPVLADHLRMQVLPDYQNRFELLEADAMDFPLGNFPKSDVVRSPFKVVANLPYSISTPWMDAILESENLPKVLVLMLQKEAADRFSATVGTKDFSALSIFLEAAYERVPGHRVPSQCFFPQPTIDSYLLNLRVKENPRKFSPKTKKIIRRIFVHRRKQLASILKKIDLGVPKDVLIGWFDSLQEFGCSVDCRPERVPVSAWLALDSAVVAL